MERNLFNDVFNGKTVLVTGHTGFKGSWLSIWLSELGAKVVGYALDPYTSEDNFVVSKLDEKIIDIRSDIRNFDKLLNIFKKYKPEIVFHLAAQPLVQVSYTIPKDTYDINIGGTVNMLEAARNTDSVRVIINVTSDKCYENKEWIWGYREEDPLGGYDPYSSSKGCSELVTAAYRNSFFNPDYYCEHKKALSSVRAGNVIGGGDWAKYRIIPDCIRAIKKDKKISVRNPYATRPWQHVLEPLSGYLLLASKMYQDSSNDYSGAWNFGPGPDSMIMVKEIVKKIIKIWGKGNWVDLSDLQDKKHEARLLSLDISKARNYLKWHPTLAVDQCLKFTLDWYKNKHVDYSFSVKQIEEFVSIYNRNRKHGL